MTEHTDALAAALWAGVSQGDGCWEWLGSRDRKGYGRIWVAGYGQFRVHRLTWELTRGTIPDGMLVCHSCDNPPCCNPAHLWLGTNIENTADRTAKGRNVHGEDHVFARLTTDQVREIRSLYGSVSQRRLAARYRVSQGTIWRIATGRKWTHV